MSVINLKKNLKKFLNSEPEKAPTAQAINPNPIAQKIDRLGVLKGIIEPVKAVLDEFEKLKKELVAIHTSQGDPDGEIVLHGEHYTLVLGPRANERSVTDPANLYEILGHADFLAVMKPSLTELDKRLKPHEKAKLIVVVPGNRKFKAIVPMSSAA